MELGSKSRLFIILFVAALSLPAIQCVVGLVSEAPLFGVEPASPAALAMTPKTLLDGSFQDSANKDFGRRFGFRNNLIRIKNQLYYSLFGESTNQDIIVGKQGQLLQRHFIVNYLNVDLPTPRDYPLAERRIAMLKPIQDYLESRGKKFIIYTTPTKPDVHPEFIPDNYLRYRRLDECTNGRFLELLRKYRVNHADTVAPVIALAKDSAVPLFPKGGTHWNTYAAATAVRAILEGMRQSYPDLELPQVEIERVDLTQDPLGEDADLANLLNLYFREWHYPSVKIGFKPLAPVTKKYRWFVEGGSFDHKLIEIFQETGYFDSILFYFYNYQEMSWSRSGDPALNYGKRPLDKSGFDWKGFIDGHDIFALEVNVPVEFINIGSGFIEELYNYVSTQR